MVPSQRVDFCNNNNNKYGLSENIILNQGCSQIYNNNLYACRYSDFPNCNYCGELDDLTPIFVTCSRLSGLFQRTQSLIRKFAQNHLLCAVSSFPIDNCTSLNLAC